MSSLQVKEEHERRNPRSNAKKVENIGRVVLKPQTLDIQGNVISFSIFHPVESSCIPKWQCSGLISATPPISYRSVEEICLCDVTWALFCSRFSRLNESSRQLRYISIHPIAFLFLRMFFLSVIPRFVKIRVQLLRTRRPDVPIRSFSAGRAQILLSCHIT